LQLELNKVQWKVDCPIDLGEIGNDDTHTKLTLEDMVQTTIRIMAVVTKQCIKSSIEGFE
jgi:hypothetical protein